LKIESQVEVVEVEVEAEDQAGRSGLVEVAVAVAGLGGTRVVDSRLVRR